MLKLKFLNFTKKPKKYRLVKDTRLVDNELMRYRIQVKGLRGWKDEVFKTEHPICWVKSKDEGVQIVKLLKGIMIWQ